MQSGRCRRLLAGGIVASAVLTACQTSAADPLPAGSGVVEYVVDGDTIDVTIEGVSERVRLIGIDTPESVHRDVPVECFGIEASDHLRSLLPSGTTVRLERDAVSRDRYGRLLAYVYRSDDDLLVNLDLVEGGYADAVTFGDNEALYAIFSAAEATARAEGRGLWGVCGSADVPAPPG